MIIKDSLNYFPLEINQVITGDGKIVYDRNNSKKSYCYIDLNTNDNYENER